MEATAVVAPPLDVAAAVRMADEGIPVRAIARTLTTPSADIYELLREAIDQGTILEMPRDEWPQGSVRSTRTLFIGSPLEKDEDLRLACASFFKASPLEAAMLALMLRRDTVTKSQLHTVIENTRANPQGKEVTDIKMVDVLICKLRKKLKTHDLYIETMWGHGYAIGKAHRETAVALLLKSIT